MIAPTGMAGVDSILRELKTSQQEDQQINREQANSDFNQKIAELKGQVDLLKHEAKKIGGMAIFNFVVGIVTTVMKAVAGALGGAVGGAAQIASKVLDIVSKAIGQLQGLINGLAAKDQKETEAKVQGKGMQAEIYGKNYEEARTQEQDAKKQAEETLQTIRQINQDMAAGDESMVKAG